MNLKVVPLSNHNKEDFYKVHSAENGHDWCFCVAWWAPTWNAWNQRTADENRKMREQLFQAGIFDGYLLYDGEQAIGWCQCSPRDRFYKLALEYKLSPDPDTYAVTCFVLAPAYREIGLGHFFLAEILEDLKGRGVRFVEAFPRRGENLSVDDLWTGPEKFFQKAEFILERDDVKYPVYRKQLI